MKRGGRVTGSLRSAFRLTAFSLHARWAELSGKIPLPNVNFSIDVSLVEWQQMDATPVKIDKK